MTDSRRSARFRWTFAAVAAVLVHAAVIDAVRADDAAAVPVPRNAAALPEGTLKVRYTLYWGGLKLGEAQLSADLEAGAYEATSKMTTGGIVRLVNQAKYDVTASGHLINREVQPLRYFSHFDGGKKFQKVELEFEDGMPGPTVSDPPYGKRLTKWPVSADQKTGSVDPLSGLLFLVAGSSVTAEAPCGTTVPVFDGRRRYNLNLSYKGRDKVSVRGGKVFKGRALRCDMEYEKVAGFKSTSKELEQEDDALPIPPLKVWMADDLITPFVVPVKIIGPTDYGAVTMILDEFKLLPSGSAGQGRSG